MASISSLMGSSSSTSSIYGSRSSNIISGLASGLDTESLIEGMVESYKQKITSLQQDRTKVQWQQEAYQSISDKLVEFSRKYTSYTSTTNLLSNSFFNNAVITSANGKYADLVTASGKSNSEIILNSVKQLATAARYQTSAANLGSGGSAAVGSHVDLSKPMLINNMTGTLDISYNGNEEISIKLEETDDLFNDDGSLSASKLQKVLEEKLADQKLTDKNGDKVSAADLISVEVTPRGAVGLTTKGNAIGGADVKISGASGDLAGVIQDLDSVVDQSGSFQLDLGKAAATIDGTKAEYLSGKTFSVTLNGQTKKVTLGEVKRQGSETWSEATQRVMQEALDGAFGKDADGKSKIEVELRKDPNSFAFNIGKGNTLSISSTQGGVGEILFGEGNSTLTSYLDTSKSLGSLGTFAVDQSDPTKATLDFNGTKVAGTAIFVEEKDRVQQKDDDGTTYYTDREGNKLDAEGYRVNSDGERLYEFDLTINGVKVGTFNQDTALETVTNAINSNAEAGVSVNYSKLTNQFVFTAKSTGAAEKIDMGDGLAKALFGDSSGYEKGQDAVFTATVNGSTQTYTRSSNLVDLDGLKVTLNGTFDPVYVQDENGQNTDQIDKTQGVTFSTKTDTDTIVDAIKQMVEDYNTMVTEVKKAYSDMPLEKSDGSSYEPLTADDEADMTESEIKAYEEKAKTGILFMDSDLSSLYSALRGAVVSGGSDGSYLRSIGINTSYSDGLTTISLDESALRDALENDLDGVRDAFTKSKENGAATDGLMTSIQKVTDQYAATTGAVKGILIEKAGSQYSPTAALDNTMLNKMEEIDEEIEKWQDKMSDKVDYYTNKFTQLEVLINQMNSQSSALSGLTSG